MRCAPTDREAHAIALLVDAHLNPPDEWQNHHFDSAEEAAKAAAPWVQRDGREA